jgi:hypothetical protein
MGDADSRLGKNVLLGVWNKTSSAVNNASLHVEYSVLICILCVCMLCHSHNHQEQVYRSWGNANTPRNGKLSYFFLCGKPAVCLCGHVCMPGYIPL